MDGALTLNPQTLGILAAAAQGLQASGPSRMPVSMGGVLGQGLGAGIGAYQQAALTQQRQRMAEAQLAEQRRLHDAQIGNYQAQAADRAETTRRRQAEDAYFQRPEVQQLLSSGNVTGVLAGMPNMSAGNLAQFAGVLNKKDAPVPIGSGGLRMPDGTVIAPAPRPPAPTQLEGYITKRDSLAPNDPLRKIYDQAITHLTNPQSQKITVTTPQTVTGDALDMAAQRYLIDGTLPPSLGRGGVNSGAILGRAAVLAKDKGLSSEAVRIENIANKANATALADLSKRESQVGAFEKTFVKNTALVEELSRKTDRTGVPLVNKWINAGKRALTGDPDLAAFDATIKGAVNEYTKIVSGSMGNVAMAEGEIKKIEGLLNAAQTPAQVTEVLNYMKKETQNRMAGFKDQKSELMGAFGARPPRTPSTSFNSVQEAERAMLPKGTRITIGGRPATVQ